MRLNPNMHEPLPHILYDVSDSHLIEPYGDLPFVRLMSHAHVIITDSSGAQEKALSLGKRVPMMRETTERPAAVFDGSRRLMGTPTDKIVGWPACLLTDQSAFDDMSSAHNSYGDGKVASRIRDALIQRKAAQ